MSLAAEAWDLPAIETARHLADWLAVGVDQLDWFADLKAPRHTAAHYHYRILPKGRG